MAKKTGELILRFNFVSFWPSFFLNQYGHCPAFFFYFPCPGSPSLKPDIKTYSSLVTSQDSYNGIDPKLDRNPNRFLSHNGFFLAGGK